MRIGDRVRVDGGMEGTVVAVIDDGQFSAEYPEAHWAYLETGLLVMTEEAGLVHLPDASDAAPI